MDNVKRRRLDFASLRPGIGLFGEEEKKNPNCVGVGTLPVQPQYEAVRMSTAELLQVLQKANIATVISQHMQQAQDVCYDCLWPKEGLTEEWVEEHVHKVFMDDYKKLSLLGNSVAGDDPATKLNKLVAYQPGGRRFYGYELRMPVNKKTTQYIKTEAL
jgi:hypothetical protein